MKYDSRTLKYAILGLLIRKQMTGYDITKEFERNISEFWTAKHSQIYPELKRLAAENLITYEIMISGEALQKKMYTITDEGKQEFLEWLSRNEDIESPPKDVFRLRTYFFDLLDTEVQLVLLSTQLNQHKERLSHLEQKFKKYQEIPSKESAECGDYLVLQGAVLRENAQIQWLENCIQFLQK